MPNNSRPAWVSTVGRGKPGISAYGIVTSAFSSSANAPSPVPRMTATSGTIAVRVFTARTASVTETAFKLSGSPPLPLHPARAARRAGARAARGSRPCTAESGAPSPPSSPAPRSRRCALRRAAVSRSLRPHARSPAPRARQRRACPAQLLRRDERFVHRFLAFAKYPQLFGQCGEALLEDLALANRALQRVGDAHAKVVDSQRVVAPQRLPKLLLADVVRCQVEGFVVHGVSPPLGPKRAVPNRITVAPSRTAGA